MSSHYSTNDFLPRMPAKLMAMFFKKRGLLWRQAFASSPHGARELV